MCEDFFITAQNMRTVAARIHDFFIFARRLSAYNGSGLIGKVRIVRGPGDKATQIARQRNCTRGAGTFRDADRGAGWLEPEEMQLPLMSQYPPHHENSETRPYRHLQPAGKQTDLLTRHTSPEYRLIPVLFDRERRSESTLVWRIELHGLPDSAGPLRFDVARDVVLGRSGGAANTGVDIDLAPYHAFEQGVSRRHAMLHPTADGLYLIDLKSTNGTMHNGVRLGPGVGKLVQTDDHISFGGLAFTLKIVGQLRLGERD